MADYDIEEAADLAKRGASALCRAVHVKESGVRFHAAEELVTAVAEVLKSAQFKVEGPGDRVLVVSSDRGKAAFGGPDEQTVQVSKFDYTVPNGGLTWKPVDIEWDPTTESLVGTKGDTFYVPVQGERVRRRSAVAVVIEQLLQLIA